MKRKEGKTMRHGMKFDARIFLVYGDDYELWILRIFAWRPISEGPERDMTGISPILFVSFLEKLIILLPPKTLPNPTSS